MPAVQELSARDLAILGFEREWLIRDGHKQQAIREVFGFTPSHYYALLGRLVESPHAMAHDPLLVRRLRRQRQRRSDSRRQAGTGGTGLTGQVSHGQTRPASK